MSDRPLLLDLFCGAGGAAMGYHRAGFDVVGVDIVDQPRYPFTFHRADALTYPLEGFDAVHASPPCQAYIRSGNVDRTRTVDLLGRTREHLEASGLPWVIENVPGAPMRPDAVLCGSQFGLEIRRHRWFELSWRETVLTLSCDHSRPIHGVYGALHGRQGANAGMLPDTIATRREALGIDWTSDARELAQAIPPAYTELVGALLLERVKAEVAVPA